MILLYNALHFLDKRFPRRCGGDPNSILELANVGVVFPAGAGVIPIDNDLKFVDTSFPRRCGGDPFKRQRLR